jgi:hypothetical protein
MTTKLAGIVAVAALVVVAGVAYTKYVERSAVSEERRERTADAIELIRTSDKKLNVVRKATDADLCRELGGVTVEGVCQ